MSVTQASWNVSMDIDFHERFDKYRKEFIKLHGTALSKSEFGRFLFEVWEERYLEIMNTIEDQTEQLNKLSPGPVKLIFQDDKKGAA